MELIILIIVITLFLIIKKQNDKHKFSCPLTKKLFKTNLFANLFLYIAHVLISIPENSNNILTMACWVLVIYVAIFVWLNVLVVFPVFLFEYIKYLKSIK